MHQSIFLSEPIEATSHTSDIRHQWINCHFVLCRSKVSVFIAIDFSMSWICFIFILVGVIVGWILLHLHAYMCCFKIIWIKFNSSVSPAPTTPNSTSASDILMRNPELSYIYSLTSLQSLLLISHSLNRCIIDSGVL